MRTVVDTSVALKWYFPESGSERAQRVLAEAIEGEAALVTADARLALRARTVLADVERIG